MLAKFSYKWQSDRHMGRVFITGGAGFIGSHLAGALLERGDEVVALDNESTGSAKNVAGLLSNPRFRYHRGSVADRELVRSLLTGADQVYHLAAAVGVQLIASNPIQTIESNVYLTELLLAEMRSLQQQGAATKLFLASSSEVYGKNPRPRWDEEEDLVFGPTTRARWSYGVSKAIDEFLAMAYHHQHGLPVVVGRFFNVVGPRQTGRYGMVLPRLVDAALAGGPLVVHDDGRQIRCFAHVRDVVRAVMGLMDCPEAVGQVFNIGSDRPISILELAQKVADAVHPNLNIDFESYEDAFGANFEDVRSRVPDLSKLRNTLGEQTVIELDEIIAELVALGRGADGSEAP